MIYKLYVTLNLNIYTYFIIITENYQIILLTINCNVFVILHVYVVKEGIYIMFI